VHAATAVATSRSWRFPAAAARMITQRNLTPCASGSAGPVGRLANEAWAASKRAHVAVSDAESAQRRGRWTSGILGCRPPRGAESAERSGARGVLDEQKSPRHHTTQAGWYDHEAAAPRRDRSLNAPGKKKGNKCAARGRDLSRLATTDGGASRCAARLFSCAWTTWCSAAWPRGELRGRSRVRRGALRDRHTKNPCNAQLGSRHALRPTARRHGRT